MMLPQHARCTFSVQIKFQVHSLGINISFKHYESACHTRTCYNMRHLNADRNVMGHNSTIFKVVHNSYTLVPLWFLVNVVAEVALYKKLKEQNFVMCLVSRYV
jgi:outer membrane receptor for Fe3+-dicitrate